MKILGLGLNREIEHSEKEEMENYEQKLGVERLTEILHNKITKKI